LLSAFPGSGTGASCSASPVAHRQAGLAGIVPPVKGNCFVILLNPVGQGKNYKKKPKKKEQKSPEN